MWVVRTGCLVCLASLLYISCLAQAGTKNTTYLLKVFRQDRYHGETADFFYLYPYTTGHYLLSAEGCDFAIDYFKFFEFGNYLYKCCSAGSGYIQSNDSLAHYAALADSAGKLPDQAVPYLVSKKYRHYQVMVYRISYKYCRCTPQFDNKASDGTPIVAVMPRELISYAALSENEKLFFEKNFKLAISHALIKKFIPALR
jgi:hypothetical protein